MGSKIKKRNGSIDFWKFIFSILILVFHGRNLAEKGENMFGGYIGVEFFFIVSGIFMAASEERSAGKKGSLGQDTFLFMKKKLLGLMPNIYVAWMIGFFVEHIGEFSFRGMLKDGMDSVWELLFISEAGFFGYKANAVTWYISAMLLAMFLIFPIMRKYGKEFYFIIAPLMLIFLMGITNHEWGNYRAPHAWVGYFYKSFIRAVMGITFGCLCYKAGAKVREVHYTNVGKVLFTFVEWSGYGAVIAWTFNHKGSKTDWILVLLLAISIVVSFSQVSLTDNYFSSHQFVSKLGEFSFSLFLGHGYWSHKMKFLFPNLNYIQRLPIYITISFVTGIIIMLVSIGLKNWWARSGTKFKKLFIEIG